MRSLCWWLPAVASLTLASPARAEPANPKNACLVSYEAAQRLRLQKKLEAAHAELLVCSRNECPAVLRRDCAGWLGEVEAALPSFVVAAKADGRDVADVRVLVDGEAVAASLDGTAIAVDPGRHELRFEREGSDPISQTLLIREGEKNRSVTVDFGSAAPPPRGERNMVPVYGLAALGAIGLGSFTYFGLRSHAKKADLESCKGHCPVDDVDAVKRDQLVADVSLGLGLVALGAAAYLYFGGSERTPPAESAWSAGFTPLPSGGAATVAARF
jgi:hypothetical protein